MSTVKLDADVHEQMNMTRVEHSMAVHSIFSPLEVQIGIYAVASYIQSIPKDLNEKTRQNSLDVSASFIGKLLVAMPDQARTKILKELKDGGLNLEIRQVETPSGEVH